MASVLHVTTVNFKGAVVIKRLIFATFTLFLALPASAEFVEHDWQTEGDTLTTLDTTTGLEWLDLTVTDSNSINEVRTRIAESGDLFDWHLPTFDEIKTLASNLYPSVNTETDYAYATMPSAQADAHRALFGETYPRFSYGTYTKADVGGTWLFGINSSNQLFYDYLRKNDYTEDYKVHFDGVFLVSGGGVTLDSINNQSSTDVSAPALGVLFSAGLFLFIGFRRREMTY